MNRKPKLLERLLNAVVEGRAREAQRFVERYVRDHGDLRDRR